MLSSSEFFNSFKTFDIPYVTVNKNRRGHPALTAEHIRMHCLGLVHFLQQQRIACKGRHIQCLLVRIEPYNFVVTEEYRSFSTNTILIQSPLPADVLIPKRLDSYNRGEYVRPYWPHKS